MMSRDLNALTGTAGQRLATPNRLRQRVLAKAVGTGLLVCAVIGSGIAAERLSPNDTGLQLLENAITTGTALTVLALVLQPVSAAFNQPSPSWSVSAW